MKVDTNKIRKTQFKLDNLSQIPHGKMILISSGQISPCKTVVINGYNFDLVTSDNDTIYLATHDKKFQTPEGFKVGTKLSELPKRIQSELNKEPDWGYYYKLSSGWSLGFCEGNSCTENYPKEYSKVKWLFKRR
ncbi:MAG: hypothetical protein ABJB11_00040 [Ferruginibacter sp.]